MLYKFVLDALVTSVLKIFPSDNCQSKYVSTVPKRNSPFSAFFRAPFTLSKIQLIFVDEKYGSNKSPVLLFITPSNPSSLSFRHCPAVLLSCHTMALYIQFPVFASHTSVVSR